MTKEWYHLLQTIKFDRPRWRLWALWNYVILGRRQLEFGVWSTDAFAKLEIIETELQKDE